MNNATISTAANTEIYESWVRDWICEHEASELRQKRAINGQVLYREQCLNCGATTKTLRSRDVDAGLIRAGHIPLYDEQLQRVWYARKSEDLQQRRESAEHAENEKWWRWYNQYLTTPQWQQKRRLVFLRAGGLCEGCRSVPAAQVHHLTYERAGDELLFDLVAVCRDCHQRAHPDKVLGGGDD